MLNRKLTIGSADALIEARLGVGKVLARHHDPFLDQVGLLVRRAVENFRFRRRAALQRLVDRNGLVDHPEGKLRGLAEDILEPLRVLQAGHLDEDAVDALALDQRLDGADLVDAPLDDLDRLLDRLPHALDDAGIGELELNQTAGFGDVDVALAGGAEQAAQRLRQFAELGERLLRVLTLADAQLDAVTARRQSGIADTRFPQDATDVVEQGLYLFLAHGRGVDLEQDVRAALQVETEHDVTLRPYRQSFHGRFGEEIRDGAQAHDKRREENGGHLPR